MITELCTFFFSVYSTRISYYSRFPFYHKKRNYETFIAGINLKLIEKNMEKRTFISRLLLNLSRFSTPQFITSNLKYVLYICFVVHYCYPISQYFHNQSKTFVKNYWKNNYKTIKVPKNTFKNLWNSNKPKPMN